MVFEKETPPDTETDDQEDSDLHQRICPDLHRSKGDGGKEEKKDEEVL